MFFKKKYTPQVIDEKYSLEELIKFSREYGNPIYPEDISTIWNAYAIKIGLTEGLIPVEANSFGFMVSTFLGGMGMSCSTEYYFREEEIEYKIVDELNKIKSETNNEEEQIQKLWAFILNLYLNNIEDYTLKTENLHVKLSISMYQRFMNLEGDSKTDKLRNLLDNI